MIVHSLADITGDGAVHALSSDTLASKWILLLADANNTGTIRIGGLETTSSRGLPLIAGSSVTLGPIAEVSTYYPNGSVYYYAANGDKLYVLYSQG